MRAAGYEQGDVWCVADAYGLAIELFSARFRAYGKPFVDHLVGTAGVLVSLEKPVAVVTAGLLHAGYEQGDFGFVFRGSNKASERKRRYLRERAGSTVEDLVYRYTNLRWDMRNIGLILGDIDTLDQVEREVLTIRLANELDDYRDLAMLHIQDHEKRLGRLRYAADSVIAIAQRLGHPQLGDELREVFEESMAANPNDFPRRPYKRSYVAMPLSYRRSVALATRNMLGRMHRKLFGRP